MLRQTAAVSHLIEFLETTGLPPERGWPAELRAIRDGLGSPSSRGEALARLGQCFGGMGSLNDYVFHPANGNVPRGGDPKRLNDELEQLLDRCYREYRLLGKGWMGRLYWRWLAARHRGASPRVLNAFARRPR